MEKISVVVSCYNEEESIPLFYNEIKKVMSIMKEFQFEVLFVDDGSKDRTLEVAKELAKKDECIKYVSFSRNFGKEAAMYAGLSYASGEYVTIMDADLQDPPSLLPEMMRYIKDEGYDSVATRRVTRKGEPKIRSFFARRFYHLIKKISDTEIVDGARDYRLMTRQFVNSLLELEEYNRFSKGLYGWVGYKTKWMEYENVERVAGETKWSFWKLFVYAIEGTCVYIDYRNCCKNTDFWRSDIWMAIYGMYYAIHRWNSTVLYRYFGGVFCKSIYGIEKKTNFYLQRDKYSAIGFYI